MSKLRVLNFGISLDGYVAGPNQSLDAGLGEGGEDLHQWMFDTRTWRQEVGQEGGTTGVDDRNIAAGIEGIGAHIMGRNMFGPIRGEWGDSDWSGWWGDDPPYHHDVFVLTHHAHDPIPMAGGTTFHFVTEGIEVALERAMASADGQDVRLGGGCAVVQQYLAAGLVDELHLAYAPILLRGGERLFADGVTVPDGYEVAELVSGEGQVAHARIVRSA
ncbi:MAG TPA: dihydrofolate reductase family protein [Iamia sp.]|nr:dihydrofolate reductase family protein [Iamia sp.]